MKTYAKIVFKGVKTIGDLEEIVKDAIANGCDENTVVEIIGEAEVPAGGGYHTLQENSISIISGDPE